MYTGRILVADSNPLCRGGVIALLRGVFPQLVFAEANDMAAVAADLSSNPTDIAAVDIDLPGLNGVAGLRFLRGRFPESRLIALAWVEDGRGALQALGVGVHGYIPKSLTAPEMLQAFQMVIAGQIYVPPKVSETAGTARNPQSGASTLTERQTEVIRLLAAGQSNKEIARTLHIAEGTVKVHIKAVFKKIHARNRTEAAKTLVILDEIHHAGDAKSWGEATREAFERVIRLEFPSDHAGRIIAAHDGLEVDYHLLLLHRTV